MVTLKLLDVKTPKKLEEKIRKSIETQRALYVGKIAKEKGEQIIITKKKAEELLKMPEYNKLENIVNNIIDMMEIYIKLKHKDKETGDIVVPWNTRKTIAKINQKMIDVEDDGVVELSDDQTDFLIGISREELPLNDTFVYFIEYLEDEKLAQKSKE